MIDLASNPRWRLITPACVLAVVGTVVRIFSNKDYIRTFVRHSHDDVMRIGEAATQEFAMDFIHENIVASKEDRSVKRAAFILTHLVNDNPELYHLFGDGPCSWRISVINQSIFKITSFPNGYIFVHQGMMETANTDDELAFLLGHELAVIYLRQVESQLNQPINLWKVIAFILEPISFRFYSDFLARLVARLFMSLSTETFNKAQAEVSADLQKVCEADKKACQFIIKSCYDPRAVDAILLKMFYQESLARFNKTNTSKVPSYYSTNPIIKKLLIEIPEERTTRGWSSKDRLSKLDDHLAMISDMRHRVFSCPPLPTTDPRKKTVTMERLVNRYMKKPSASQANVHDMKKRAGGSQKSYKSQDSKRSQRSQKSTKSKQGDKNDAAQQESPSVPPEESEASAATGVSGVTGVTGAKEASGTHEASGTNAATGVTPGTGAAPATGATGASGVSVDTPCPGTSGLVDGSAPTAGLDGGSKGSEQSKESPGWSKHSTQSSGWTQQSPESSEGKTSSSSASSKRLKKLKGFFIREKKTRE